MQHFRRSASAWRVAILTLRQNQAHGPFGDGNSGRTANELQALDELPDFPLAAGALGPLRAAAERQGAVDFTPLWSGQAAALGRAMPAGTLTVTLAQEALARFGELCSSPHRGPH